MARQTMVVSSHPSFDAVRLELARSERVVASESSRSKRPQRGLQAASRPQLIPRP